MPNQPKTPKVSYRLADAVREKLQRIADERGISLSELLRRISTEYAERWPGD